MKTKKNILVPSENELPKKGTKAAKEFFETWKSILDFLYFIIKMVSFIDTGRNKAIDTLISIENDEEKKASLQEKKQKFEFDGPVQDLKKHSQFLNELLYVRLVESYLNYLSSILYEIFTTRHETLRSSDKIELAIVLKHSSIESLVREIAERKIESLSYSSFSDLSDFFKERFNVDLFSADQLREIIIAIETRNISVHNRCYINKRYIQKTAEKESLIGKKKILGIEDWEKLSSLLLESVKTTDEILRIKLKLKSRLFKNLNT